MKSNLLGGLVAKLSPNSGATAAEGADAPAKAKDAPLAGTPKAHLGAGLAHTKDAGLPSGVKDVGARPLSDTAIGQSGPKDTHGRSIAKALAKLPEMDRQALRQGYDRPTTRMCSFLGESLGKTSLGTYVAGIPQFECTKTGFADDHVFEFRDLDLSEVKAATYYNEAPDYHKQAVDQDYLTPEGDTAPRVNDAVFRFTGKELREWQDSARTYYAPEHYGADKLAVALQGKNGTPNEAKNKAGFDKAVAQAFKAKFVVKMGQAPVMCNSSGDPLDRADVNKPLPTVWMASQCGVDLDFRTHDRQDTLQYVQHADGSPLTEDQAQELEQLRNAAIGQAKGVSPAEAQHVLMKLVGGLRLNEKAMIKDAVRMKSLYMEAQVDSGVDVPVLVAMGCGVFARWFDGVPDIMAEADRQVLNDPQWKKRGVRGVVYALPRFSHNGHEPFERFQAVFKSGPPKNLPVLFVDQDALTITRALSDQGYTVSLQNPADSDLSAGEYWENRGPALEEWLALTTGMLLSQHATINPKVANADTLRAVEAPTAD